MSCCNGRHHVRVGPRLDSNPDMVEIRSGRYLRIQHFNKRKRDDKFAKEMQIFMNYKQTGMLPNVATHLSVQRAKFDKDSASLPPVPGNAKHRLLSDQTGNERPQKCVVGSHTAEIPDRGFSGTSGGSEATGSVMSSSNVDVSLDPRGRRVDLQHVGMATGHTIDESGELETSRNKQNLYEKAQHLTSKQGMGEPAQNSDVEPNMVMFFIHGVGGSSDIWRSQIDYFSALGYEIVCPDLIGHGLSFAPDHRQAYHFDEILADLDEVFDKYCKRKNVIIGHSYGCAFATVLARQRSSRVCSLILVSGGGPNPLAPQTGVFTLPICMLSCLKPCLSCLFNRNAFNTKADLPVPKEKMFDIPSYVLSHIMNGQYWPDGDDTYHSWVAVSTLLVYGQHDRLISLQEEEDMNKTIYGSQLEVVTDAGHMVMIETPDTLNRITHQFIEEGWIDQTPSNRRSSSLQNIEESSHLPDRNKSPHLERIPSRSSHMSIRSAKSVKSSKSMPRGLLTMAN